MEVTQSGGAERHVIVKEHQVCVCMKEHGVSGWATVKGITCELAGVCITAFGDAGAIETDLSLLTRTPTHTHTHMDTMIE